MTKLAAPLGGTQDSNTMTVDGAVASPAILYRLDDEVIRVFAALGTVWSIRRGIAGTAIEAHGTNTLLQPIYPFGADPGILIDDEGVALNNGGSVGELDFAGAGVSTAMSGSKAVVTIPGGGAPAGGWQVATVDLDDPAIKALPTTAFELIAAPGLGKALAIPMMGDGVGAGFFFNWVADYTNLNAATATLVISLAGGAHSSVTYHFNGSLNGLLSWGAPVGGVLPLAEGLSSPFNNDWENIALTVAIANNAGGNLTGGDPNSFFRFIIPYMVVDLTP